MLSAALRGHIRRRAFDDLQKRLLNALARYVARDRNVLALSCNLIDLVDINNAALRLFDVVIGVLNKFQENIFNVLADVARLRERRCIARRKRHVQNFSEGTREKRFTASRRSQKQNIALFDFHIVLVLSRRKRIDTLIMIVHRHGENLLRLILPDNILIEFRFDFGGFFEFDGFYRLGRRHFLQHIVAEPHTLIANKNPVGTGNQFFGFCLLFSAEGTILLVFCHWIS